MYNLKTYNQFIQILESEHNINWDEIPDWFKKENMLTESNRIDKKFKIPIFKVGDDINGLGKIDAIYDLPDGKNQFYIRNNYYHENAVIKQYFKYILDNSALKTLINVINDYNVEHIPFKIFAMSYLLKNETYYYHKYKNKISKNIFNEFTYLIGAFPNIKEEIINKYPEIYAEYKHLEY